MLWIPITIGAASLQVARNALQRGLLGDAGPWGATLVRFLFGLPFSASFVGIAWLFSPGAHLTFGPWFWVACVIGGATQMIATAALLVCMQKSSFALGAAFSQCQIPISALIALALGDHLGAVAWVGLVVVTFSVAALAWPRNIEGTRDWSAALLGLVSGTGFSIATNAYRQATLGLDHSHPALAAQVTVFTVQVMQSAVLVLWLTATNRRALKVAVTSFRSSAPAGFFGAAASGLWFTAYALAPVGPVRAVGVVELPIAALTGRRVFAERLSLWQISAVLSAAVGVVMAALG